MRAWVGTSGYDYDAWKGNFYPDRLARSRRLAYYAAQFPTVEINYTFSKVPDAGLVARWAAQVPRGFRFSLKASQRITHHKRLLGAGDELAAFSRPPVRSAAAWDRSSFSCRPT